MVSPSRPNRPPNPQGAGFGASVPGAGGMPPIDAPELQGMHLPAPQLGAPPQVGSAANLGAIPGGATTAETMLTEREIAQQAAKYTHAGMLSAEQVISGDADKYLFLEPKLLEIVSWVQQALVQAERSDDLAKARTDPVLRMEISEEIDRLALSYLLKERGIRGEEGKVLIAMVINEIVGLGPLEPLWQDPEITEVICNGPQSVFVERSGRLVRARGCRFRSQGHLLDVCQRILAPLNRKVDVRDPLADGRLPDGSRVNVVHHAVAPSGPLLTIRRFPAQNRTLVDLVNLKSMDEEMAALIATLVANRASTLVVGGTGSGKALDVATPIPTPRGFVPMGELQVGSVVFDETGEPTQVVGAFDVEEDRECFEVVFSDGSIVVADGEHLWLTIADGGVDVGDQAPRDSIKPVATQMRERWFWSEAVSTLPGDAAVPFSAVTPFPAVAVGDGRMPFADTHLWPVGTSPQGEPLLLVREVRSALGQTSDVVNESGRAQRVGQICTTKQIMQTLRDRAGRPNHFVPAVSQSVQYAAQELPIPPRLLGAWLADPSSSRRRMNIACRGLEPMADTGLVDMQDGTTHLATEVAEHLDDLAVLEERHIPVPYMTASTDQRLALLSGIMPTVLSTSAKPCEFTTTHVRLARDVRSLAASLGYVAMWEANPGTSAVGPDTAEPHYTVRILREESEPTSTALATCDAPPVEQTGRFIVDVRPVASRPVRCIRVENPSHMFLAGESYIPTHNTTLLNALSAAIPRHERVITIEDSLELRLHPDSHVAAMEARPADATGSNAISIRNLVKNALRMRPDRIIVGEIRDAAALDMLQACNTGHEGSMSTVHANGPDEAISRLTVMVAQGGEIPAQKVEWLIGSAIDLMVIARRFDDGARRVAGLYEVPDTSTLPPGESLKTIPLWEWEQTGVDSTGKAVGRYVKRNDISEHLRKERGLDHGKIYSWQDVVSMSADKPGEAFVDASAGPQKPTLPRPSVRRPRKEPS